MKIKFIKQKDLQSVDQVRNYCDVHDYFFLQIILDLITLSLIVCHQEGFISHMTGCNNRLNFI